MKTKLNGLIILLSLFVYSAYGMMGKPGEPNKDEPSKIYKGKDWGNYMPIAARVLMPDGNHITLVLDWYMKGQQNVTVSGRSFYRALAKKNLGGSFIIYTDNGRPITMDRLFAKDELDYMSFYVQPGIPQ